MIYTFPTALWHVASLQFSLLPLSSSSPQSAFNPLIFTTGPTSEFWQVMATLAPAGYDDWRVVSALLRKLRGRLNKIRLYDPSRRFRGSGGLSPTLNILENAPAGSTSISLYGLLPNQARAVAADDVLGIGENLFAASDDAPSNANGEATVNILAPLRQGVASGDPVNTYYPTGLFQLIEGGNSATVVPGDIRESLTLQFMESPDFD